MMDYAVKGKTSQGIENTTYYVKLDIRRRGVVYTYVGCSKLEFRSMGTQKDSLSLICETQNGLCLMKENK